MFRSRRRRQALEEERLLDQLGNGSSESTPMDAAADATEEPEHGPYDFDEAPADGVDRLDLGSVRLPIPAESQLQVEVDPGGAVRAVHLMTSAGRLTVSAFAAPRSGALWPEVSKELAARMRENGVRVRVQRGQWGNELLADSPDASLRFVGVDGPRWLLRGEAAGPADRAEECAKLLYELLEGTIVVRGAEPLPVRTPLAIELPEAIAHHIQQAQQQASSTV